MENKKEYPELRKVAELLSILLSKDYKKKTIQENQALRKQLDWLQQMTFDQSQRYGNPNYRRSSYETELRQISQDLREHIANQIIEIDISKMNSAELWAFFISTIDIDKFTGYAHSNLLGCSSVSNWKECGKKSSESANQLLSIIEKTLKKVLLSNEKRKGCVAYLRNIQARSSSSSPQYTKAQKLIADYAKSSDKNIDWNTHFIPEITLTA